VVSEKIAQISEDNTLWSGLMYSAHPLSCATGVTAVEVYEEDGLIDNATEVGKH
jgi:taurine--2-oxoglutarate transaminase